MAHEVWEEVYDRLVQLINEHQTTLVFVNTRRMAERLAARLSDRLGEDAVTAHHGSLAKGKRLEAEDRLRTGKLRALVATASLELGIDIGHVDLACQLGSPHSIATFLQRVGRSGHTVRGTPTLESRDLDQLRRAYPGLTQQQENAWRAFFENVESLSVTLDIKSIDISGDTATADVDAVQAYRAGRQQSQRSSFRALLKRAATGWRITQIQ